MGATLATLRKYIRAEVGDPAPLRKLSTLTLTHDGSSQTTFFQDASHNFVALGVIVGDVIYNPSDGGSLAVIRGFEDSAGGTNDKLMVSSIEGGTGNTYEDADVVQIYDRHAQKGLDGTRWTDTEVEDALAQSQKLVALRFGGIQKYSIQGDIKVMSKIDLTVQVTDQPFTLAELVTGGGKGHTAKVEYVGDTFIVVSTFYSKLDVTAVAGTLETGEIVTGGTSGETGILIADGTTYLMLANHNSVFTSGETLTGGTSGATVTVDDADYAPGVFAAGETLTGGTSTYTANVKATYAANNTCLGQDMPTDVKHLLEAKWWDGSHWMPLWRESIREFISRATVSGDPHVASVFGVDQLISDSTPNKKIWLWPSNATAQYNELHLFYMAWDRSLADDTDTTNFDNRMERLVVLEGAKILSGQVNEDELWKRIVTEIAMTIEAVDSSGNNETDNVSQVIDWDSGYGDGGAF
jgi:hypothetical protein